MAYFRQTDSLDDLKQQYKRLLTKFDYKDPKNAKLLEAIDKEYKKCQMYAKMAPLRKAKDDISRKLDESERERVRQEQERAAYNAEIKRRTQMHYTKADCERYLNEACRALKNYAYLKVRDNTKTGHSSTCRSDLYNFRMDGYRKTYINMRTLGRLGGENSEYSEIMRATDNVEIAFVALSDEKIKIRFYENWKKSWEWYMLMPIKKRVKSIWMRWNTPELLLVKISRIERIKEPNHLEMHIMRLQE